MWVSCVSELCVSELWRKAGGGRREEGVRTDDAIVDNQKQEPHTMMWGKNTTASQFDATVVVAVCANILRNGFMHSNNNVMD